MKLNKLQITPLSERLSIFATILVVIITCIVVLYVAYPILFNMGDLPYEAPDANHIMPVVIIWIIALAGGCGIFIFKMKNRSLSRICRISAFALISLFTFALTNDQSFYSYDNNYNRWVLGSVYGNTKEMYANYYARVFGNVLLMKNNEKQRYNNLNDWVYPHLYLPNGNKTTLPWVRFPSENYMDINQVNFAYFRNNQTSENIGIVDGNLKIIVSPDTCNAAWSVPNDYFIVRNIKNKEGLINIHGDVILPFIYDGLRFHHLGFIGEVSEVRFFEGGFLETQKDGEILYVDTLGNTLSEEEYYTMHPNETHIGGWEEWEREHIPDNTLDDEPPMPWEED